MAEPKYVGVNIEPMPDGYLLQKQEIGVIGIDPALIGNDTADNIGSSGEGVFKEKVDGELRFKKLKGGGSITSTPTETDELLINGAAVGEVNTAANIGTTGEDVFKEKVGAELRFRKIKGGGSIEVSTTDADEILISGTAGEGLFKEKVGAELQFKRLKAGSGVAISPTVDNEIEISAASSDFRCV